jgi:hypothetical protein
MFTVRCTKRLLARLKVSPAAAPPEPTTRLGDWYANFVQVGQRRLVLLVSDRTFLPVVIPAAPIGTIVERFRDALTENLQTLGIDGANIDRELAEMAEAIIGPTRNRQVTGVLVDLAKALTYYAEPSLSLLECSSKLAETPLGPLYGKAVSADRATVELFQSDAATPRNEPHRSTTPDADDRPEVRALFSNLKAALPALETLLAEHTSHWGYEDAIYRFYHQSFKVYRLQEATINIVAALQALAPKRELNGWFLEIVKAGTGRTFELSHNSKWPEVTRPIVEAFFHARYFLEMAVRYGKSLKTPPLVLPSGWAAFLYVYRLR